MLSHTFRGMCIASSAYKKSIDVIMDVFECITSRKNIFKYQKTDVSDEILGKLLDAATYAPSAGNIQPWEFIVVKDPKMKKELALQCLQENIIVAQQQADDSLPERLKQLKLALNGNSQQAPEPALQFIRQLRSQLWIVRQFRGLS